METKHKTLTECKDEVARNNNFDSFERAIRYTFNRELLPSEKEFINKIIDEAAELYAGQTKQSEPVSLDLLSILEGIDKTDSEGGWWDTSVGAEFGKNKLKELQILFDKAKQPASIALLSDEEIKTELDKLSISNDAPQIKVDGAIWLQSELRKRVIDPDVMLNDVLNGFISGKYKQPKDSNSIAQFVIDYLKTK